ncbi:MAG: hypothetical protein KDH08_03845 [Anaerolineae bacterium]|nr:hypothetical protein [Anaerolineae bacterium]
MQRQRVDHQGGRPALHGLAAALEDLLQVAGELKGQRVQAVLRLAGERFQRRVQAGVVQRCGCLLQLGQVFVHRDGVKRLVAGQRDGSFQGGHGGVQRLIIRQQRRLRIL